MYPVSDAYKEAMKKDVQSYRMRGSIGKTEFADKNILTGSFSISNQCSDTTQVQIGQVYTAELKATFLSLESERYALKDAEIRPSFGMRLATREYEDIPLGIFTISEANWGESGVEITAYDNMSKLDKSFSVSKLSGKAYRIASLACRSCGLELATTPEEFESFANGDVTFTLYPDNEIDTWRDLISWLAQSLACNVFADREGKIVFRSYGTTAVDQIDAKHRFTGCKFGDYITRYTGLSCVDIADQMTRYYAAAVDDGLTYNLGMNPLLQSGDSGHSLETIRRNILNALSSVQYVPFTASMIGNPAYDLMDVFHFTGGYADDDKLFCMTKYVFTYNQKYEMEGVGKNPALETANSKSDKNISGLMEQVNSITDSINNLLYDYNTSEVLIGQTERIAGLITYYIKEEADVEGHFLMHYRAEKSTRLIIRIYDLGVEELYSPLIYDLPAGDGTIGIPHSYLHRVVGTHTATITAQCTVGTIHVPTRSIFYTINAGNFAEAVDEIGMDIRDITMRQLLESNGPDQIWCAGIEDGKLLVSRREYQDDGTAPIKWEGVYTPGEALDAAIEFDGTWVLRTGAEKFTIETDDEPWLFWISDAAKRTLYAQHGSDESTRFVMEEGVNSVHACKGYSSEMYPEQDQGLVVVYVKTDETVWYRQYTLNTESGKKVWSNPVRIATSESWKEANVHRLNDYRLSFELSNEKHNVWMITGRTYVGQSVYPENAGFNGDAELGFSFFRNGDAIDFDGYAVQFDDKTAPETEFHIRYPYSIRNVDKNFSDEVKVVLNGKELARSKYSLKLDGTDLVITTKEEIAATRAEEAKLAVTVLGSDCYFYLSNDNNVHRILLSDQDFNWTVERPIIVINIEVDEEALFNAAANMSEIIRQVNNYPKTAEDSGTFQASAAFSLVTKQVGRKNIGVDDAGQFNAAIACTITTSYTGDAPI